MCETETNDYKTSYTEMEGELLIWKIAVRKSLTAQPER